MACKQFHRYISVIIIFALVVRSGIYMIIHQIIYMYSGLTCSILSDGSIGIVNGLLYEISLFPDFSVFQHINCRVSSYHFMCVFYFEFVSRRSCICASCVNNNYLSPLQCQYQALYSNVMQRLYNGEFPGKKVKSDHDHMHAMIFFCAAVCDVWIFFVLQSSCVVLKLYIAHT